MKCCSLEIPIMVFAKGLQDDGDGCHDRLDNAELESRLENTLQFRGRRIKQARTPWRSGMNDEEGHQDLFAHLIRWKRSVTALITSLSIT